MNDRIEWTHHDDGVVELQLARADKMNALDAAMFSALIAAGERCRDDPRVRAVVFAGRGKAFCAGLVMESFQGMEDGVGADLLARTNGIANAPQQVAWVWRQVPVPVIAAVHGVAFGAGSQIMAAADIRIVHPDTRIAIMEMRWGLVPDVAGMALWRTQVADDVLREMIYTNREFNGSEAKLLGFATHVSDDPLARAMELAHVIADKNPHAIRGAKRLCNMLADATDAEILQAESDEQVKVIRTPNQMEAVMAGMEKRKPNFVD
ncbi:MAG: crotonase/enoyl-CoA hydratase family protein [Sphingopyxis sp.]|nr:crotonase/enoyl-CoA hydratase family protein [Sphingopyxis sp.]